MLFMAFRSPNQPHLANLFDQRWLPGVRFEFYIESMERSYAETTHIVAGRKSQVARAASDLGASIEAGSSGYDIEKE